MAKSLRAKIKRRFRKLKKDHLGNILVKPQVEEANQRCEKALAGIQYREKQKKNAFLHPDDPEAHFPQYVPPPIIDLRSTSIPGSGTEFSGGNRKKAKQPEHLDEIREKKRRMKERQTQLMQDEGLEEQEAAERMQVENPGLKMKKKKKSSKIKKTFVF